MSKSVTVLLREAEQLDAGDRAALAGLLLESLDPGSDEAVDAAWAEAIEQRVRELDAGTAETLSWEALRERLDARGQTRAPR